jgi:5'-phosphate synthase pdxT subunit
LTKGSLTTGVLGLQGDIEEHLSALDTARSKLGIEGESILVKSPDDVNRINTLVIPGGESTTMGSLSSIKGLIPQSSRENPSRTANARNLRRDDSIG